MPLPGGGPCGAPVFGSLYVNDCGTSVDFGSYILFLVLYMS